VSRKVPFVVGETSRTACARTMVHSGVDEKTGELLTAAALAERVGWCIELATGMVSALLGEHSNATDVDVLAAGVDAGGRKLPSNAWMALRRLGWSVDAPAKVNDRIVRAAQEQAGRALRSVKWRADVVAGVLAAWPADPNKRTEAEWEQVRAAAPAASTCCPVSSAPVLGRSPASSTTTASSRPMCSSWNLCRVGADAAAGRL
jgi:hypothetical protein